MTPPLASTTSPLVRPTSMQNVPHDVLVQITAEVAALQPHGPPAASFAFLSTCHHVASARSPALSTLIFQIQFDTKAYLARGLAHILTPTVLGPNLEARWRALKRIRWAGSSGVSVWGDTYTPENILHDMRVAFTLVRENDGMNWKQLFDWAMLPAYVRTFVEWDLLPIAQSDFIPPTTETRAIGTWLLWLLSDFHAGDSIREIDRYPQLVRLFRAITFCPQIYPASRFHWYSFSEALETDGSGYAPYGSSAGSLILATPSLGEAASNLFFANLRITALDGSLAATITNRRSWLSDLAVASATFDKEWARQIRSCPPLPKDLPPATRSIYMPGTLTGIYEGMFVIPALDAHQRVGQGVSPILAYDNTHLPNHVQAWSLREHVCMRSSHANAPIPLLPGRPLDAFLPERANLRPRYSDDGVTLGSGDSSVFYRTWRSSLGLGTDESTDDDEEGRGDDESIEIVVTGEAIEPRDGLRFASMMMPGSTLQGTIRRRDGMVTLRVTPFVRGSGQWLYIGRVLETGVWMGRWRCLGPSATNVEWEGVFKMYKTVPTAIPEM